MFGIGVICFIYAPLLLFLKAPPTKEEKKVGDDDDCVNNGIDIRDENGNKAVESAFETVNLSTKL